MQLFAPESIHYCPKPPYIVNDALIDHFDLRDLHQFVFELLVGEVHHRTAQVRLEVAGAGGGALSYYRVWRLLRKGVILRIGGARVAIFFWDRPYGVPVVILPGQQRLLLVRSGRLQMGYLLQQDVFMLQDLRLAVGIAIYHGVEAHFERNAVRENN